ncbi:MAG: glycosyltransferase, partial [Bacteroidales bacterium]
MVEKTKYKILLVNKFYYQRGGDCIQMMSVERLLKKHGHQVAVFSMQYPQNIKSEYSRYFVSNVNFAGGLKHKTKAIGRILGLGDVRSAYLKILDDFKPDIVHLHNIHSYISPIVAKLAKERGCRVVWVLHDYKLVCPSYSCLSAGKPCEACFTDKMAI